MDEDVAIRLLMLDQKMAFLFQILSLTKTTPDGQQTTRSLGQLFEDGRELVSFRSMEDLREKIDHYLPLEEERREIARKGHERALRDHSFELRLPLLVETAFGRAQGYPLPEIAYADD